MSLRHPVRLVGFFRLDVSLVEYRLFYRGIATPYKTGQDRSLARIELQELQLPIRQEPLELQLPTGA